jgi:undecaprenyl-diphosphatase
VYLFIKGYRLFSLLFLAGMGGNALIVTIAKELVKSPRPLNGLVYDTGFSFPSGHITASVVFCGLLTYFAWQHWRLRKVRVWSGTLSATIVSLVAFDRLYLNVHWFSDVVGGYFLGLFWLTFCLTVFAYMEETARLKRFTLRARVQLQPKQVSAGQSAD